MSGTQHINSPWSSLAQNPGYNVPVANNTGATFNHNPQLVQNPIANYQNRTQHANLTYHIPPNATSTPIHHVRHNTSSNSNVPTLNINGQALSNQNSQNVDPSLYASHHVDMSKVTNDLAKHTIASPRSNNHLNVSPRSPGQFSSSSYDSSPRRQCLDGTDLLDPAFQPHGDHSTQESSPDREGADLMNSVPIQPVTPYSYGLPNLGNTCYMNSVLQCLLNNENFKKFFLTGQHLMGKKDTELTEAFGELLCTIFSPKRTEDKINGRVTHFKHALERVAPIFEGYAQNDAHEFFRLFIEKLHDELNFGQKRNDPYVEFKASKRIITLWEKAREWKQYSRDRDSSLITGTFGGTLLNEVHCKLCNYTSYTFEDALDLSLNLSKSSEARSPNPFHSTNLVSCLKEFIEWEFVEGYACASCKKKDHCYKRSTIWRQPDFLVVQFKRFVYDMYGQKKAVKNKVAFNLEDLSLDPFTHEKTDEPRGAKYKLYGLVNHFGTLNNGHYISFIYNDELKSWLQYNDKVLTKLSLKDVVNFAHGATEPYILFYKRV